VGGHGDMLSSALAYSNVAFGGAISICMLNLLGNAVRGTGNKGLPAAVMLLSFLIFRKNSWPLFLFCS
jgi:Na+-driven multidrug efflux pump